MVEIKDVHLAFEEHPVFDGLNLSVKKGERLVVLGQSGSGKSTALRLILGIVLPDKGSIRLQGKEVTKMGRYQLNRMRSRVGMVYQYSALISSLTVRDNLALPLEELTDAGQKEIDEIIDEKLHMVGLPDTRNQLPSELSGGMRKRIGLARALVLKPEIILFDEPTAGLDPIASSLIDELIIDLTEKTGATSIIATHEMESAFRIATRMAMLYEGRIIAEDEPERFKHSSNPVVEQFISGSTEGPILQSQP